MAENTMTDKEFRHLSRSDLLDIIYEYQKQEAVHLAEIEELKQKLSAQEIKIKNAGSIAEAVVGLSDIFETAQKTADKFLQAVYDANMDAELEADRIIEEARLEAELIVKSARMQSSFQSFSSAQVGSDVNDAVREASELSMAEMYSYKAGMRENEEK